MVDGVHGIYAVLELERQLAQEPSALLALTHRKQCQEPALILRVGRDCGIDNPRSPGGEADEETSSIIGIRKAFD